MNSVNFHTTNHNHEIPPLFSVIETDHYYMIAVDLPTIPSTQNEISVEDDELSVSGILFGNLSKQKIFNCLLASKTVGATYKDGKIWLSLPKTKTMPQLIPA